MISLSLCILVMSQHSTVLHSTSAPVRIGNDSHIIVSSSGIIDLKTRIPELNYHIEEDGHVGKQEI